jgi:pectate lyase
MTHRDSAPRNGTDVPTRASRFRACWSVAAPTAFTAVALVAFTGCGESDGDKPVSTVPASSLTPGMMVTPDPVAPGTTDTTPNPTTPGTGNPEVPGTAPLTPSPEPTASGTTTPQQPDVPTTPTTGVECRVIGWASRVGRSGGSFNVTGGGNATPVVVDNFADLQEQASGSEPRVIYIDGTVGAGFRDGAGDRLDIGANKTIAGLRPGTELKAAILISGADSSNVILRNIVVNGPGSDDQQSWDNLNITSGATNIWVDHSEFWDGQDGNADVIRGADNVTFTNNIFGYRGNGLHNLSNLVASSDNEPESQGKLNITLMFNQFLGAEQRTPRCRYGDIHVVNNLFTTGGLNSSMGTSPGVQCRILTENNHFIGISEPIHQRAGGINELRGENIFEGTRGNTAAYGGAAFNPPYEYGDLLVPASQVRGLVEGRVGATLDNPTQCDWE